jgi:hypothetical protein
LTPCCNSFTRKLFIITNISGPDHFHSIEHTRILLSNLLFWLIKRRSTIRNQILFQ